MKTKNETLVCQLPNLDENLLISHANLFLINNRFLKVTGNVFTYLLRAGSFNLVELWPQ